MKNLIFIFTLILIPFASHAEWNNHFKHRSHDRAHNNSHYWEDVEHRQYRQETRIERGMENGQLTRREARKLLREQKHVAKQIRHLKRHRYLNHHDKREVMEHLDYASQKIRRLKHNQRHDHSNRYGHRNRNQPVYSHSNNRNYRRDDRHFSWAASTPSASVYFRF